MQQQQQTDEIAAKDALRTLVNEAVAMAISTGLRLDQLRGVALFDPTRDAPLISLGAFDAARQPVIGLQDFVPRFGAEASDRILLQFVYQYFSRVSGVEYQDAAFESIWLDFMTEVQEPNWVIRGVANVRNFDCQSVLVDLGDGITIRGRSDTDLASLGFGDAVWNRIWEDCHGLGVSSFVLVAEHLLPKTPANLVQIDLYTPSIKSIRAMGALRLADAGSISVGSMWVVRVARFNVGIGGLASTGVSIPGMGSRYVWSDKASQLYPRIYRDLAHLEKVGYRRSPGNLDIALRAFMATYDRWPSYQDSQLLDSMMALEALLGTETEIAFKLAFRVAGLLATDDNERTSIFELMKDFYDTRSTLVHGSQLKEKHRRHLQRTDDLRAIVRRLLRSFVAFAVTPPDAYSRAFFREKLDVTLLNAAEREKLRAVLAFDRD